MNEYIINAIDIRKKSFFDYYEIKDKKLLIEIDELFNNINILGQSSKDVSEFETKFANSSLNTQYLDLLTKTATSCKLKEIHVETVFTEKDVKEKIKEDVKDELKYLSREVYIDACSVTDKTFGITDKIRDTPVLGELWEIENQTYFFSDMKDKIIDKFKKNKKDNEETENIIDDKIDNND